MHPYLLTPMKYHLLLFFFVSFLPVAAQKGVRESCEMTTPPVIDGIIDPNEWSSDWNVDSDGKFLYSVCNDADNLYIRLKISDDLTQRKIALFGLSVKFALDGKKKGKLGLKYPVGKDESELKNMKPVELPDAASRDAYKRLLLSEVEVLELLGLAKQSIVSSRLGLLNGIQVFISPNAEAAYVYEAKIPFKAFKIDKTTSPILGITIETGKQIITTQSTPQNPQQQGQPGQRGFGQTGYGRNYSEMSISGYMWVAVKLK